MARPPLPLGTAGNISTTAVDPVYDEATGEVMIPGRWKARARYRDYDGVTRHVVRYGSSQTKATRALRQALRDRGEEATASNGTLTTSTRFAEAADVWLDHVKDDVSGTTYDRYRSRLNNHVRPALGQLLLRECTTGRISQYFDTIKQRGLAPTTRRGIRTVVSGVLGLATERDILTHNPVTSLSRIKGGAVTGATAFTSAELLDFLAKLNADDVSERADVPDLVRFLFGTGVRIGEALALRWCDVNLADESIRIDKHTVPPQSVWINGTIVDVQGRGLTRNPCKSKSDRIVGLPEYLYTLLLVRKPLESTSDEPVFPSGTLGWRHPSNVQKSMRRMRERVGYPGFTTHVGRKTVATVLDEAGQSARQIADQLGHAQPSMTQNTYMARGRANPDAASALDKVHRRD